MTAPAPAAAPTSTTRPHTNDVVIGDRVVRFDVTERVVHWVSACTVLVAVATGAILYVEPLAVAIGRRALVKDVHVIAGIASIIPVLVAVAVPRGAGLRRDIQRFSHWHDDDVAWFRRRRRPTAETGKFNGGQKLNAVLLSSALVVLLMTGSIMRWFGPFPLEWRTGATFVHDWVSFGLWFLIPAHIIKAVVTPGAVRGMWTGLVSRAEAESRPRWWASLRESATDRNDR